MVEEVREELLDVFREGITLPFTGSIQDWCENNIVLPPAYAIPGPLKLEQSPYLDDLFDAIKDPMVKQVNAIMATQIGKSLLGEVLIPYWIINNPGPTMRLFHNNDISATFAKDRLIPLLKNCEVIKPLLKYDRFAVKNTAITLPHMSVIMKGANDGVAHGLSIKYLLCDEVHEWALGMLEKFIARTTAFAGRRKIIISSQPNCKNSELHRVYNTGKVYEWHWQCPNCKTYQPYYWTEPRARREDESYAGFVWQKVLNLDGSTNIAETAKTVYLECKQCRHKIHDTPVERKELNKNGKYICIKNDGADDVVSYTAPNFVNVNLTFASAVIQYLLAKRFKEQTGLDDQMQIFVTQVLGRFYHAEVQQDIARKYVEQYSIGDINNKNWLHIMTVDVQRNGSIKYYVVWAYNRNGNESKRADFGIARTWEEIEAIRLKHNVLLPLCGIDSGDNTTEVYQECIKHGTVVNVGKIKQWVCWTPMKGDSKTSWTNHPDKITRFYAPISNQDAQFPFSSKYRGIPAPLLIWSSPTMKYMLMRLRDNEMEGITWRVDKPDNDFDTQLFSEGLVDVTDKKTGLPVKTWRKIGRDNHYLDCCAMNLLLAIKAGVFSPTAVNESELSKLFKQEEEKNKTN